MVRMANVYLAEGSLENAYMLYLKFMTLFLEKIRKHPEYNTVPPDVRAVNQAMLKEVMPKAEKLKQKLLDQYAKEHAHYKEYEVCIHIMDCIFLYNEYINRSWCFYRINTTSILKIASVFSPYYFS